jgi:hypothetical protein
MPKELHDLTVTLIHTTYREDGTTPKAYRLDDGAQMFWVPASIAELTPNEDGKTHTLTIPMKWAYDHDLI